MTLTDVLPSLRRSLPDPLAAHLWPAATTATVDDLVVAGVSMLRLVALCDTPCVHTAPAPVPGSRGRASLVDDVTVVVLRVVDVLRRPGDVRVLLLDGDLADLPAVVHELRLVGRASTAHDAAHVVRAGAGGSTPVVVDLPSDLRPGDLVACPCPGDVALRQVRGDR